MSVEEIAAEYSPSERDLAIYHAICVDGQPAVDVAREHQIAPTTARNIAGQAQRALARKQYELTRLASSDSVRLRLQRLEAAWAQMMGAWHESKKESRTYQVSVGKLGETKRVTTRSQTGNPRYVAQACKIMAETTAVETLLEQREKEEYQREHAQEIKDRKYADDMEFLHGKYERPACGDEPSWRRTEQQPPQETAKEPTVASGAAKSSRPSSPPVAAMGKASPAPPSGPPARGEPMRSETTRSEPSWADVPPRGSTRSTPRCPS